MVWRNVLGVSALLVGLAIGGSAVIAQDRDKPRTDAGDFTLVIRGCQVHPSTDKGEAWDVNNGKPDLMVIVRTVPASDRTAVSTNDSRERREFKTKEKEDTFSADFNEMVDFGVRDGQMIEIEVVDVDVAVNDRIGRIQEKISAAAFKDGKRRFENFGRVIHLEMELRKSVDAKRVDKK